MPDLVKPVIERNRLGWMQVSSNGINWRYKNTDPACSLSPLHQEIFLWLLMKKKTPPEFIYKDMVRFNSPPSRCSPFIKASVVDSSAFSLPGLKLNIGILCLAKILSISF